MYKEVKAAKPWVKVGVSPFGIWRPGNPAGIAGFDQYAELYADAKLWLNEGWVDYFSPQLYWPIAQEKQSFPKLLAGGRAEHQGTGTCGRGSTPAASPAQKRDGARERSVDQIELTRKRPRRRRRDSLQHEGTPAQPRRLADELKSLRRAGAGAGDRRGWPMASRPRSPKSCGRSSMGATCFGSRPDREHGSWSSGASARI